MNMQLGHVMPEMVSHVDLAREAMLGGMRELQSSFGQDIHTLAGELSNFANQLVEQREKDQSVLGDTLGTLCAGLKLMSSAVLETYSLPRLDKRSRHLLPSPLN